MANCCVQLLSLLFGIGSWIAITGLWLEMPLLIQHSPEGWPLASYLNIMIQFANIGPILYWIAKKFKLTNEISASHLQLFIGLCACLLLITAWDKTLYIMGKERSVVLFVSTFGLALVDCTSSVTFLPFMARFDSIYLTPYLVGEGLSGFIPSIVALLQGVGDENNDCNSNNNNNNNKSNITQFNIISNETTTNGNQPVIEPRFSVEVFFSSLLLTLTISWIAFILLQFLPICKREMRESNNNNNNNNNKEDNSEELHKFPVNTEEKSSQSTDSDESIYNDLVSKNTYIYLLCLMCWCCMSTFGFMPSLQPYSSLPYGNDILHYVVILSGLSYPLGCFFGMFVDKRSLKLIYCLTIIGTLIAIYIIICAIMSPNPPLNYNSFGGILMIISWISFTAILSYTKTMITLLISDYNGDKGLFWVGMNTQFGACVGAGLMFLIINYTKIFQESKCD